MNKVQASFNRITGLNNGNKHLSTYVIFYLELRLQRSPARGVNYRKLFNPDNASSSTNELQPKNN